MIGNKIRLLEASEIECRVGSIGKNGLSLLLYKDARVDQKIFSMWVEKDASGDRRKSVLYGRGVGCRETAMDSQAGCRDGKLHGKRKGTGIGQLQTCLCQLGNWERAIFGSVHLDSGRESSDFI